MESAIRYLFRKTKLPSMSLLSILIWLHSVQASTHHSQQSILNSSCATARLCCCFSLRQVSRTKMSKWFLKTPGYPFIGMITSHSRKLPLSLRTRPKIKGLMIPPMSGPKRLSPIRLEGFLYSVEIDKLKKTNMLWLSNKLTRTHRQFTSFSKLRIQNSQLTKLKI